MTTALAHIAPLPTQPAARVVGYTAQEIADIKIDAFRAGYRLGRIHEAEAQQGGGRPPTVRT